MHWILTTLLVLLPCLSWAQASRNFTGGSDVDRVEHVEYSAVNDLNTFTVVMWIWRNSTALGYPISKAQLDTDEEEWTTLTGAGVGFRFTARRWDGASAYNWDWNTGDNLPYQTWTSLAFSYDYGSTSNDPLLWYNGGARTLDTEPTPAGTRQDQTSNPFIIGNTSNDNRAFSGYISWTAYYNALLTEAEIDELAAGTSPELVRTDALVLFVPVWGEESPELNLGSPSGVTTGTVTETVALGSGPPTWLLRGGN